MIWYHGHDNISITYTSWENNGAWVVQFEERNWWHFQFY